MLLIAFVSSLTMPSVRHSAFPSFGYLPAGVTSTFQYDLKSAMCAFTSSSDAPPDNPRRYVRLLIVPSTTYSVC